MPLPFTDKISGVLKTSLRSAGILCLQVNMGYRCNMGCTHCHVRGGPNRSESMDKETVNQVLAVLKNHTIQTLDITGGAPEMNPHFTFLVAEAKKAGCHIISRSNLTIFFEKGFEYLTEFYADHNVEVSASLPCYTDSGVDTVRGAQTFEKCIRAIRMLNLHGYGDSSGKRILNLVYNPSGAFLAPSQQHLEQDYRRELMTHHGVTFNRLLAFSNMPIGRFRHQLEKTGSLAAYLKLLEDAFNPLTLNSLMCRNMISVGWDGRLYDCDFNQALGIQLQDTCHRQIGNFDYGRLTNREICVDDHCYVCTAGQGST